MVKHYYRLVYWKRRLLGAGRAGGRGRAVGAAGLRGPSAYRRRTAGARARMSAGARPVLVFAVIVGIVLALSALLGGLGDPGAGRFGGGL